MSDARLIHLPGIASAHSHAFQRAIRGRTHQRRGSFFSWREAMYELADRVGPDALYDLSHYAFVELAESGVTAVGEFHYVHHQRGGEPYDDRLELSDSVIRAARDAGLRITLLRVLYHRAGAGRPAEGAQRRFSDPDPDIGIEDAMALSKRFAHDPCVRVGVALHSVRACPIEWFEAAHAAKGEVPLHAHVSEVQREIEECLAEHGARPITLLDDRGVLDENFVAVHATHLDDAEIRALGSARARICVCRTTERDLGDGTPPLPELLGAGARLCFGVDSHAVTDPFEEARAAELDARVRAEQRALIEPEDLLAALSAGGYAAVGFEGQQSEDSVALDADHPSLFAAGPETEAIVFSAAAAAVRQVTIDGTPIVVDGEHVGRGPAREAFLRSLRHLLG